MLHYFKQGTERIALDSASGAVHVLSALAYKMLPYMNDPPEKDCPSALRYELAKYDSADIEEAYSELYSLYENGTLFSKDVLDGTKPVNPEHIPVKSMCLHVSHDCNMRCKYCFADTGDFKRDRSLMSLDCGKRAIDFLLERSLGIKNLELDFFGGEPLMNFDVVKELVKYGRAREAEYGKHIRFTMTTNGSLLDDESIDFINEHMSNVVLSIDGLRETNDRMRTFEDGSGTYDVILPKFKALVAKRGDKDYYARGTYTHENLHFADDVLHLVDEGFDQVSVEPVVLPASSPLALREEDMPTIFKEYEKLACEIVKRTREGRPFNFFHFMIDLDAGPCVYKRTRGCGSGSEYVAVTPDGDIYPCHQFVEHEKFKIGNIFDGTFDTSCQKCFASHNILTTPDCQKCWAKYFCGGGCAANNYNVNHDIAIPYKVACELEKKRVECALYIKAELAK